MGDTAKTVYRLLQDFLKRFMWWPLDNRQRRQVGAPYPPLNDRNASNPAKWPPIDCRCLSVRTVCAVKTSDRWKIRSNPVGSRRPVDRRLEWMSVDPAGLRDLCGFSERHSDSGEAVSSAGTQQALNHSTAVSAKTVQAKNVFHHYTSPISVDLSHINKDGTSQNIFHHYTSPISGDLSRISQDGTALSPSSLNFSYLRRSTPN
ncbi:hypothetical protein RRG08_021629 [Elysia crispata]|uniref:Uncharacterized protein n=1 Tax=Elysia crispata TaxID=231223 RepID=A0AAE0XDL1_9GAST|nr:hypothetical protein RRG08_021629 [Elysia crispata]